MEFINDLDLKKQAKDLGIKFWQTPGFLFMGMGLIAIIVMAANFFISRHYYSPEVLIISECLVVALILIIGNSIIKIVEQFARINKMKSEFVSIASHQLRTPLSAIKWETELILTKLNKGLKEKQIKNIRNISDLSERMIRLVNDLLDVARIDQGRLVLKKEAVDISQMIEEVIQENTPLIKGKNIKMIYSNGKKIPLAYTDPVRTKLVIENLLGNSMKYTMNGGKIEIKLTRKNGHLIFSIRDNGVGIPTEQQQHVFEKFFRSDNIVKHQTEGTGLGLYIAKNIVEQLGGRIWFESIENVGSVFNFSLPVFK